MAIPQQLVLCLKTVAFTLHIDDHHPARVPLILVQTLEEACRTQDHLIAFSLLRG